MACLWNFVAVGVNAHGSDATVGTVAIYRPWGNVCIFLRAGNPSRDLITLGHISEQDVAKLKQAKLGEVTLHQ